MLRKELLKLLKDTKNKALKAKICEKKVYGKQESKRIRRDDGIVVKNTTLHLKNVLQLDLYFEA